MALKTEPNNRNYVQILKQYEICIKTERDQVLEQLDSKYIDYINKLFLQKWMIVTHIQQQYDHRLNVVHSLLLTLIQSAITKHNNSLPHPNNNNDNVTSNTNNIKNKRVKHFRLKIKKKRKHKVPSTTSSQPLPNIDETITTTDQDEFESPITNESLTTNESIPFVSFETTPISALNYNILKAFKSHLQITCNVCNKTFNNKSRLSTHMKTHRSRFPCPHCSKQFINYIPFQKHINNLPCQKRWKCERCLNTFAAKTDRTKHRKSCKTKEERQLIRATNKAAREAKKKLKRFQCDHCVAKFKNKSLLKRHLIAMHGIGEKPFECNYCKRRFTTSTTLNSHVMIHTGERPYQCNKCWKQFRTNGELNRHGKKCETLINPSTNGHVKLENEVPYLEHIAKKKKNKLHQCLDGIEVPKLRKYYQCSWSGCNKGFDRKTNLQKHFRSHTGEKPYACWKCGKKFSDNSNRNRHSKKCKETKGVIVTK